MDENKTYIIGNWKMKLTSRDMLDWFDNFHELVKDFERYPLEVILAPSLVHIPLLASLTEERIKIAAQDVSVYQNGAYTGEVGAFQIKDFCSYAIVGHSERKESLETVLKKRNRCLEVGIIPIVCFTNPQEAKNVYTKGIILSWEDPNNISVNGVYREKDPEDIVKGVQEIISTIPDDAVLIYGGSVNRQNIKNLVNIRQISGVLVGNASLDARQFLDIIRSYEFRKPVIK